MLFGGILPKNIVLYLVGSCPRIISGGILAKNGSWWDLGPDWYFVGSWPKIVFGEILAKNCIFGNPGKDWY